MGERTATDELLEQLRDQAKVLSVTRGLNPDKTLPGAAANVIEAWRELAEALDAYAAKQKTGRMPGKVIDRVSAARGRLADALDAGKAQRTVADGVESITIEDPPWDL